MKKPETSMNDRESARRVISVGPADRLDGRQDGETGDGTAEHPFTDLESAADSELKEHGIGADGDAGLPDREGK